MKVFEACSYLDRRPEGIPISKLHPFSIRIPILKIRCSDDCLGKTIFILKWGQRPSMESLNIQTSFSSGTHYPPLQLPPNLIRRTKSQNLNVSHLVLHSYWPIHWSQMLNREWRCFWSSADRRCSNYVLVINNIIALWCALILEILQYLQYEDISWK